jgi:integrase
MEMAGKHPWLFKRGNVYYLRAKVPCDLVAKAGRTEIKHSLKTTDRRVAERAIHAAAAKVQVEFDALRESLPKNDSEAQSSELLTNEQLLAFARKWLSDQEARTFRGDVLNMNSGEKQELLCLAEIDETDLLETPSVNFHRARKLLNEAGFYEDRSGQKAFQLAELIWRADLEHTRRRIRRLKGDFSTLTTDAIFPVELPALSPTAGEPTRQRAGSLGATPATGITLDELIQRYENDPNRADVIAKTRKEDLRVFDIMRELFGRTTPVRAISREDCLRFRELIMHLPAHAQLLCPGKSTKQAVDIAATRGLKRLSPKGVNKYVNKLAAVFNYASKELLIDGPSPARGLALKKSRHRREDRDPFKADQLAQIFGSSIFTTEAGQRVQIGCAGKFWVPLLSLFMGLRQGEACQLEVADFESIEEIPYVKVRGGTDPTDKRVKTLAGNRIVPIHPKLLELGLLACVERAKAASVSRIFPEIKRGVDTYFSPYSKSFSRFLRSVGAYTRRTTFHSFRHNFRDALRVADAPEEVVEALGGWKDPRDSTSSKYGSGSTIRRLRRYIEKVQYASARLNID